MSQTTETATITTAEAIEAVAWERAPRYPKRNVNRRIVCADGFAVSVQASAMHYAHDSHSSGEAAYWRGLDPEVAYPFTTFEVGGLATEPEPAEAWDKHESGGVWAWVPRQVVTDLLNAHGGAVAWEAVRSDVRTLDPHALVAEYATAVREVFAASTPEGVDRLESLQAELLRRLA